MAEKNASRLARPSGIQMTSAEKRLGNSEHDNRVRELLKRFDSDGDGVISTEEILRAAMAVNEQEKSLKRSRIYLLASVFFYVFTFGLVFLVSKLAADWAIESAKEMHVTTTVLVDTDGQNVICSQQHTIKTGNAIHSTNRRLVAGVQGQAVGVSIAQVDCDEAMAVHRSGSTEGEVRAYKNEANNTEKLEIYRGRATSSSKSQTVLHVSNMRLTDYVGGVTFNVQCVLVNGECPASSPQNRCIVSRHDEVDTGSNSTTGHGGRHLLQAKELSETSVSAFQRLAQSLPEHLHVDATSAEQNGDECFAWSCSHGDPLCHFPTEGAKKCHIFRRLAAIGKDFTSTCHNAAFKKNPTRDQCEGGHTRSCTFRKSWLIDKWQDMCLMIRCNDEPCSTECKIHSKEGSIWRWNYGCQKFTKNSDSQVGFTRTDVKDCEEYKNSKDCIGKNGWNTSCKWNATRDTIKYEGCSGAGNVVPGTYLLLIMIGVMLSQW
eukprot:g893.t1